MKDSRKKTREKSLPPDEDDINKIKNCSGPFNTAGVKKPGTCCTNLHRLQKGKKGVDRVCGNIDRH